MLFGIAPWLKVSLKLFCFALNRTADRIIFLGFSFANENLGVLGIPDVVKQYQRTRKIYASMFEETSLRNKKVNALLWNCIHTKAPQNDVKLGDSNQDCLKLLQEIDI
jgi:hypothetical protein